MAHHQQTFVQKSMNNKSVKLLESRAGALQACLLCRKFEFEDLTIIAAFIKEHIEQISQIANVLQSKKFKNYILMTFKPKYGELSRSCSHQRIRDEVHGIQDYLILKDPSNNRRWSEPCLQKLGKSFEHFTSHFFRLKSRTLLLSQDLNEMKLSKDLHQQSPQIESEPPQEPHLYRNVRKNKETEDRINILKQWLIKNVHNPYPSLQARQMMSDKSGLSMRQIHNWFANSRKRYLKKQLQQRSKLLSQKQVNSSSSEDSFSQPSSSSSPAKNYPPEEIKQKQQENSDKPQDQEVEIALPRPLSDFHGQEAARVKLEEPVLIANTQFHPAKHIKIEKGGVNAQTNNVIQPHQAQQFLVPNPLQLQLQYNLLMQNFFNQQRVLNQFYGNPSRMLNMPFYLG